MTISFRISSSAEQIRNDGNHLEIEPILDPDCPRASFSISDGDPEEYRSLAMELDVAEIRDLRAVLEKVEKSLESAFGRPGD